MGYFPSVQQQATQFASYLCERVAGRPVSFSGNASDVRKPRRIGLLRTDNPGFARYQTFARLVRSRAEPCGGEIASEHTYPGVGYALTTCTRSSPPWRRGTPRRSGLPP